MSPQLSLSPLGPKIHDKKPIASRIRDCRKEFDVDYITIKDVDISFDGTSLCIKNRDVTMEGSHLYDDGNHQVTPEKSAAIT